MHINTIKRVENRGQHLAKAISYATSREHVPFEKREKIKEEDSAWPASAEWFLTFVLRNGNGNNIRRHIMYK